MNSRQGRVKLPTTREGAPRRFGSTGTHGCALRWSSLLRRRAIVLPTQITWRVRPSGCASLPRCVK
jgi:hypothetical protein